MNPRPGNKQEQALSFTDRLALFAKATREKASLLPPGAEKDELLRKAGRADTRPTSTQGPTCRVFGPRDDFPHSGSLWSALGKRAL
jgi:hypothetical protein